MLLEPLQTAGPLGSPDVTPVPCYYGPGRVPLAFHRLPGVSGYTASCSADFATGRGGFLQLLSMPLSPCRPYHPAEASRRVSQLRRSMLSSPQDRGLDLRICVFEATYGFTCVTARWLAHHPKDGFVNRFQESQFPSFLLSKLRGF